MTKLNQADIFKTSLNAEQNALSETDLDNVTGGAGGRTDPQPQPLRRAFPVPAIRVSGNQMNPETMTMNTQSTGELTLDELDLVNGGNLYPGKIIGAGLAGAASGAASAGGNLASRGIGAVIGFIFGAGGEIAKEMAT